MDIKNTLWVIKWTRPKMDNKNVHDPMLIDPQTLGVIKWTRPKDGHQKYPMSYKMDKTKNGQQKCTWPDADIPSDPWNFKKQPPPQTSPFDWRVSILPLFSPKFQQQIWKSSPHPIKKSLPSNR